MSLVNVVYPGSFDPITYGHLDIIERLSRKFSNVTVLVSYSTSKKYIFSFEERQKLISQVCETFKNVRVEVSNGLLVEFAKKNNIILIAKGLRNSNDYEYEVTMDHTNKTMFPEIETIYLISKPELSFISSTLVKEIASLNGDLKKFVPEVIADALKRKKS